LFFAFVVYVRLSNCKIPEELVALAFASNPRRFLNGPVLALSCSNSRRSLRRTRRLCSDAKLGLAVAIGVFASLGRACGELGTAFSCPINLLPIQAPKTLETRAPAYEMPKRITN
jgi:hypothetical protein